MESTQPTEYEINWANAQNIPIATDEQLLNLIAEHFREHNNLYAKIPIYRLIPSNRFIVRHRQQNNAIAWCASISRVNILLSYYIETELGCPYFIDLGDNYLKAMCIKNLVSIQLPLLK